MLIKYGEGKTLLLCDADMFVLRYMLGMLSQGHGHVRVRATVPAAVYLRHAYNLSLLDARDVMFQAEKNLQLIEKV